jgi:hypothetical protein
MLFRKIKQLKILFIYLGVFLLLSLSFYFMAKGDPSCDDRKRNQGEESVDCGGPCRPCPELIELKALKGGFVEWVYDTDNKYDFVANVKNLNDTYGVATFNFKIVVSMSNGEDVLQERWEKNFILPGEEKLLFVHGFELLEKPTKARLEIDRDSVKWQKFIGLEEPNFVINNTSYGEKGVRNVDFGSATGTIINRSSIDFGTVDVHVVLRGVKGELLAINSQRMNTVRAGEIRDYDMIFPHAFPGSVENAQTFVETNPFDSDNYIKIYNNSGNSKDNNWQ